MSGLKVGEVARQAGVNLQTVHYYERCGLLPRPSRTDSNYRIYSGDAVRRVRFVKRAQQLGFTLNEIKDRSLGVRSVSAVVVDGTLADCCAGAGPSEAALRVGGVGRPR